MSYEIFEWALCSYSWLQEFAIISKASPLFASPGSCSSSWSKIIPFMIISLIPLQHSFLRFSSVENSKVLTNISQFLIHICLKWFYNNYWYCHWKQLDKREWVLINFVFQNILFIVVINDSYFANFTFLFWVADYT